MDNGSDGGPTKRGYSAQEKTHSCIFKTIYHIFGEKILRHHCLMNVGKKCPMMSEYLDDVPLGPMDVAVVLADGHSKCK